MPNNELNRKINKLFLQIAKAIYKNDMAHDDTKTWWPIRPPLLDYPIAAFLFEELTRLLKKAETEKISDQELAGLFGSKEVIMELQFLWVSLSWRPADITLEDKLYLISKLISLAEAAPSEQGFKETNVRLAEKIKMSGNEERENVLKEGTKIYLDYLKALYERLGEDWEKALEEATSEVLAKKDLVKDPGPWGGTKEEAAVRKLVRNADFRRESEKGLEQIIAGVPEIPGIAEGIVGENIIVDFTISSVPPEADAFITDIDAFKNSPIKDKLEKEGIVVVSKTRNGTRVLSKGQKVLVDGTSGIVFGLDK